MTLFDVVFLLILLVSAIIGVVRGALREIVTVFAALIAVVASAFALRFTGPIARRAIDPDWAGTAAALLVVFVLAYVLVRVIGAGLTRKVHDIQTLGALDRLGGLAFGLTRGLVMLGVFQLVFSMATPADRMPRWISDAALYPLSKTCAKALARLAPQGSAVAGRLGPHIEKAVRDGSHDRDTSAAPGAPPGDWGQTPEKPR